MLAQEIDFIIRHAQVETESFVIHVDIHGTLSPDSSIEIHRITAAKDISLSTANYAQGQTITVDPWSWFSQAEIRDYIRRILL